VKLRSRRKAGNGCLQYDREGESEDRGKETGNDMGTRDMTAREVGCKTRASKVSSVVDVAECESENGESL
jgi:hypothetical protein